MASKEQKKLQKKKEREKEVRKKLLEKREARLAPIREERDAVRKLKKIDKLRKDMGGLNQWADEVLLRFSDRTLDQLQRNATILKALEEDFEQEQERRKAMNQDLEEKGLVTLEDKMKFLHDKLVEEQIAEQKADTTEKVNLKITPPKEVSEVSVIKAPVAVEQISENSVL